MVGMESPSVSEDFSLLATAVGAPYVMWMLRRGMRLLPRAQSMSCQVITRLPSFAPVIELTLRTGVDAMALAALTLLGRKLIG